MSMTKFVEFIDGKEVPFFELYRTCKKCRKVIPVVVREEDYIKRLAGAFIQDAYPYLTAAQRELFVSGICGTCWDKMFSSDDEEE
jgi:hypothetical protein